MSSKSRWIILLAGVLLIGPPAWAARGGKQPGIKISAPASAEVDQTISITVSPINGATITWLTLGVDRTRKMLFKDAAPWSFTYTIPADIVGALTFGAVAYDAVAEAAYTAEAIVQIGTPATLTSLTLVPQNTGVGDISVPPYFPLTYYGEVMYYRIKGTFSDGTERDLSDPASGTTYQSQNTDIVTITEDGGVQAIGEGSTTVIATNSGQSLTIPVAVDFVDPKRGDLTGGMGTAPDLALTYSGSVIADTQPIPLTSTTIKLPANVPQASWAFHNNSGLPQLKTTPGLVTWKLAKASDSNCSVSFDNNVLPTDLAPYAVTSGTVTFGLPPGGGKCVILLSIDGQSDREADKFTITNPAP